MKQTVNQRIMLLKTHFNMDSKQFVAKANISPTTLWSIENGGDMKPKTIQQIATAFNANPKWLLTGEGEMLNPVVKEPENHWKEEAYIQKDSLLKQVQEERDYFKGKFTEMMDAIISGKLGKLLALRSAGTKLRKVA